MSQSYRLLIAEDESELREVLQESLARVANNIVAVQDGKQAFEAATKDSYDCILSDINMPNMSGLELLKKLRESGVQTPFIIVSAYDDKERMLEALKLGAFDFMAKPYRPVELLASVKKALEVGNLMNSFTNSDDFKSWMNELKTASSKDAIDRLSKAASALARSKS